MMGLPFKDRADAGRAVARRLEGERLQPDPLVLALPRGGAPVGFEVARALDAALDVFVVRKLGVPGQPELAMGAIASGGVRVLNDAVIEALGIPQATVAAVVDRERAEVERRERAYRGDRPAEPVRGRAVALVDDGLATGATMRAAVLSVRQQAPARLVVAVPVAALDACAAFDSDVDRIVCAATPEPFYSVGLWYEDFAQTTDEEVRVLLAEAADRRRRPAA